MFRRPRSLIRLHCCNAGIFFFLSDGALERDRRLLGGSHCDGRAEHGERMISSFAGRERRLRREGKRPTKRALVHKATIAPLPGVRQLSGADDRRPLNRRGCLRRQVRAELKCV